ncbi:MAG: hypothetical protein MUF31_16075 [Akkermansiaceae bacterium]|nr:hypothetical protein [Akkermansiaceae bacterium]
MEQPDFQFERARGIVWVCDIASSSKHLNDNSAISAIEAFIPRFHWISRIAVRASGGEYIKWTGDGFLAWYPIPLHRELGARAADVFNAAWHLTLLLNVTNLSVKSDKKFKIRHGVAYEQDALLSRLKTGASESIDLLGRAVVLAFRLSGAAARFPGIVTQGELVKASRQNGYTDATFKHWKLTKDDQIRHFKGETWGTKTLYRSCDSKPRPSKSPEAILRKAKQAVQKARPKKDSADMNTPALSFSLAFLKEIMSGPEWSRVTGVEYTRFIREDLLGSINSLIPCFEAIVHDKKQKPAHPTAGNVVL